MQVRIEVVPWLTRAFEYEGRGRLVFDQPVETASTLTGLLEALVEEHPGLAPYAIEPDGALVCPHICVTLNGEVIPLPAELERTLRDGDVVVLLPAFAGGSLSGV